MIFPSAHFLPVNATAPDHAPAVLWGDAGDGAAWLTYGDLRRAVAAAATDWPAPPRAVTVMAASLSPAFVIAYLAAHAAGQVVCVVEPGRDVAAVTRRLKPEVLVTDGAGGDGPVPGLSFTPAPKGPPAHPDLAVLLPTSGSTGSPRLVRLSAKALQVNTADIIAALDIVPSDVVLAHLVPWYSYGLSILHTHLAAGAGMVLTRRGFLDAGFWDMVRGAGVTSLPGVPVHFQMLSRFNLDRLDVPALRLLTQAGGPLHPGLVSHFAGVMQARGGRMAVMYGQTEAGPRIAVHADPAGVLAHPEAAGRPLAHVDLRIERPDGHPLPVGAVGEVVVRAPSVMMGYAEGRADLARGDCLGGVLRTGDRGSLDTTGLLTLAGRAARFAKVFGLRLDLEAIERAVAVPTVALEKDERLILLTEGDCDVVRRAVVALTGLTPVAVRAQRVNLLPRLSSGKIDLMAAQALV